MIVISLCAHSLNIFPNQQLDWEEDESFGDKPEEMFPGGYDQITTAMSQGLDIRLRHVVSNVDYTAQGVRVVCAGGQAYTGRACLVTLTLGCLQVCCETHFAGLYAFTCSHFEYNH